MHYRLLITIEYPADTDPMAVIREAYGRLAKDDSFCGEGGRFGSPLCDWFVIGGRWSGLLAETLIGPAFEVAIDTHFPTSRREPRRSTCLGKIATNTTRSGNRSAASVEVPKLGTRLQRSVIPMTR